MKTGKIFIVLFVTTVLMVSLWLILYTRQQAQARSEYYATILAQAPCIANVCPGFEGRDQALERLSNSNIVGGKEQGRTLISLWFANSKAELAKGSGSIYFTTDSLGNPQVVRRASFWLDNLTLETVLSILGEPDEFFFIAGCGMGRRVHAKLFYLSRGVEIVVDYATRQPMSQMLTGDTSVHWIEYFSPADFQNHLTESLIWHITDSVAYDLRPSVTENDFIAQIRPWPGIDASPIPTTDFCPR